MAGKKSVRVQLYEEDKHRLMQIASEYGCKYDREGSLSLLLMEIAQGKLEVQKATTVREKKLKPSVPLIGLELKVHAELNGTIAKVAETIADYDGNIYDIKARNPEPMIRITLTIPKESNLNKLIFSLKQIKIKDVIEFNRIEKLKNLLQALNLEKKRLYDLMEGRSMNKNSGENLLKDLLLEYYDQSLVKNIVLTIGFRCEVKNTPGGLAKLAYELARKYISILEIDQKVDPSEQKNIADLLLGFYPLSQSDPIKEIQSIQKFTKKLKDLDYIENIYQHNIDFPD